MSKNNFSLKIFIHAPTRQRNSCAYVTALISGNQCPVTNSLLFEAPLTLKPVIVTVTVTLNHLSIYSRKTDIFQVPDLNFPGNYPSD